MAKRDDKGIVKALDKSPINYFSDLFMFSIVIFWILGSIVMIGMAIYATIVLGEVYMWDSVGNLIAIPLTGSGITWLLKCGAQHYVANSNGKEVPEDFPPEDADMEDDFEEEIMDDPDEIDNDAVMGDFDEEDFEDNEDIGVDDIGAEDVGGDDPE